LRPLYALACVIVIGSGWAMLARTESSGVTVLGVGLAMSAVLGLPLPRMRFRARRPGGLRTLRAARAGKKPRRNEIFR
jgi:hypothetical protein